MIIFKAGAPWASALILLGKFLKQDDATIEEGIWEMGAEYARLKGQVCAIQSDSINNPCKPARALMRLLSWLEA